MIQREVTLNNVLGLHARAAARLVQVASRFHSRISLSKDGRSVDAKSILGILMLAASQGTHLTFSIEGADEAEAGEAIRQLFETKFGEEG